MNVGVYNYYLYEAIGWNFQYTGKDYSNEEVTVEINKYNRNNDSYTNFLDSSNSDERKYVGSMNGKNIKIIQLESVSKYCVDLKLKDGSQLMPNFNKIINDSNAYYCSNFYTSSGQGKTADAELAINTGVNPQGPNTQHWQYKNGNYNFDALPELFKAKYDATCYSFHGDLAEFYNRGVVHPEMFGYDKYYSLEEYIKTHKTEKEDPNSYINGWVDDHVVLEWENEVSSQIDGPFLTYSIMTVSHTPFLGNPKEKEYNFGYKNKMLYRYIAYMRYVDDYLDELYERMKNDSNTIYVIYGDHGSFLTNKEQKELFGKQNTLDFEINNTKIPCVIFDASGTLNTLTEGHMEQTLLRSEIDIFTTLIDLFDLNYEGIRLGVNIFSNEKTFTYDPNTFTIITDDYIYYTKNEKYKIFNGISKDKMKEQVDLIKKYKVIVDIANKRSMMCKKEA
jgi:phosphoglycerol transferase MdoB-like AlkP superfamily enzyme